MTRQNNRNNSRDRRSEAPRRDAAGSSLRMHTSSRDARFTSEREKESSRHPVLNRYNWNDLYERSSI